MPDCPTSELATLDAILQRRHSCRAFLPRQVPDAVIRQILEAARQTASWCNAQPWQVIVTRGEATESFRRVYAQWAALHEAQPVGAIEGVAYSLQPAAIMASLLEGLGGSAPYLPTAGGPPGSFVADPLPD